MALFFRGSVFALLMLLSVSQRDTTSDSTSPSSELTSHSTNSDLTSHPTDSDPTSPTSVPVSDSPSPTSVPVSDSPSPTSVPTSDSTSPTSVPTSHSTTSVFTSHPTDSGLTSHPTDAVSISSGPDIFIIIFQVTGTVIVLIILILLIKCFFAFVKYRRHKHGFFEDSKTNYTSQSSSIAVTLSSISSDLDQEETILESGVSEADMWALMPDSHLCSQMNARAKTSDTSSLEKHFDTAPLSERTKKTSQPQKFDKKINPDSAPKATSDKNSDGGTITPKTSPHYPNAARRFGLPITPDPRPSKPGSRQPEETTLPSQDLSRTSNVPYSSSPNPQSSNVPQTSNTGASALRNDPPPDTKSLDSPPSRKLKPKAPYSIVPMQNPNFLQVVKPKSPRVRKSSSAKVQPSIYTQSDIQRSKSEPSSHSQRSIMNSLKQGISEALCDDPSNSPSKADGIETTDNQQARKETHSEEKETKRPQEQQPYSLHETVEYQTKRESSASQEKGEQQALKETPLHEAVERRPKRASSSSQENVEKLARSPAHENNNHASEERSGQQARRESNTPLQREQDQVVAPLKRRRNSRLRFDLVQRKDELPQNVDSAPEQESSPCSELPDSSPRSESRPRSSSHEPSRNIDSSLTEHSRQRSSSHEPSMNTPTRVSRRRRTPIQTRESNETSQRIETSPIRESRQRSYSPDPSQIDSSPLRESQQSNAPMDSTSTPRTESKDNEPSHRTESHPPPDGVER